MKNARLIARLDIKGPNLIKGIHLEGLRVVGDPHQFALKYYDAGIDEIIYLDIVASLYQRNKLSDIIEKTVQDVFIPITVGGGLRTIDDIKHVLRCGADKVAINTAATKRPELIQEVAKKFGSQCIVLSIEAKRNGPDKWEVYTDNGREHTGLDVIEWAKYGASLGAGEILLTSIDKEGTRKGFDIELVTQVTTAVSIPVIASGGMGSIEDLISVIETSKVDAVAMADVLHYNRLSIQEIRKAAESRGFCRPRISLQKTQYDEKNYHS
ncbi:MAG TPA: imidazole glycerol phosphate synthase cyclase subunit [Gammaproteobacteria bacterium]|nr:MAG: imidazole glycerol phosphate synthase subunit HisF [Gammaproteobacteria bacterium RIFCSPHIGHO2_12_FULL_41_20]HLB43546.1 imidazole glycerol phosphate synthase cyclase subunit [Gammaproteobacteria bacterium]